MKLHIHHVTMAATMILLAACHQKNEPAKNVFDAEVIPVTVQTVTQAGSIETIDATGIVTTENQVKYAFKTGGVIDRIYVSEGQSFAKGQLLASIKLTEIDAGLTQANLGVEKAARDYQRVSNLYKDSVATLEQLQNSKTALDIAKKQSDAIAFNKQYAYIYAANAGFVVKKIASEGEIIGGGYPVLAANENSGSGWILKAGVSDKEWATISTADKAKVVLDAYAGQIFTGVVSKKLMAADQGSGSFEVEIKLNTGNAKTAVGMFGKASIQTTHHAEYTSIPFDALVEADGNDGFVFTPAGNNHVRKVPVHVASFSSKEVMIASGLENISEVIVSNSPFLNESSAINIIK